MMLLFQHIIGGRSIPNAAWHGKPDVRLEIHPGLPHIGAERMIGCARSCMAACTNPNAQVETGRRFRVFSGEFGLPVHITAAQTTRGVIATRDSRRPVATCLL